MTKERLCIHCLNPLEGRVDKLYCSAYCRSAHHYEQRKGKEDTLFKRIDNQLKRNRRLLDHFNKAGKATVRSEVLLAAGFDPDHFTHYWKNRKGDVYLFCYEYGFLRRRENGRDKYVLVKWQDYMKKA